MFVRLRNSVTMLRAVGPESLSMMRMRTLMLDRSDCLATLSIAAKTLGLRKVHIQTVSSIASDCLGFTISCVQELTGCLLYVRNGEGRLPMALCRAGTRVSNQLSRRQGSGWIHRVDRSNVLRSEDLPRCTLACACLLELGRERPRSHRNTI